MIPVTLVDRSGLIVDKITVRAVPVKDTIIRDSVNKRLYTVVATEMSNECCSDSKDYDIFVIVGIQYGDIDE